MSWELIYTSSPRGLKPNTSGFCTVAVTAGMSRPVMQTIERLSAYEFHFGLSDPRADDNPTNYMHMLLPLGGRTTHLLSRIAYAGADYSGRTNKISHHILLSPEELSPAGPADMIRQLVDAGRFYSTWEGEPRELPPRPLTGGLGPSPAHAGALAAWRSLTGDAGWAGMLVKGFRENARIPAYLLFEPGLDVLQLYQESLALLPPESRWEVGFSTYYYANLLQADSKVHWRAIVSSSKLARTEVAKYPNAVVLDLTQPLGSPPDNMFVIAAREGRLIEPTGPRTTQPQGHDGRKSIDIRKALKKRQPAPVATDPLIPAGYGTPSTQQPSPALQSASAAYRYPDYSQKAGDIPRRTSRWTWVFAAAASLLLLSNAVTLLLLLNRVNQTAQVASLKKEAKAANDEQARLTAQLAKARAEAQSAIAEQAQVTRQLADATRKVDAKEGKLQDANSEIQELEEQLAFAKGNSNAGVGGASGTVNSPTTKDSTPATKPSSTQHTDRLVLNKTKESWSDKINVIAKHIDLSPPASPDGSYSAKVKDANVLYDPPGKIADYFSIQIDEPNAVFYPINTNGDGLPDHSRPLAICWLEDTDGVRWLRVELPKGLKDKDVVLRDSLVILLADKHGNTAFRCPLHKRRPVEVSLKVGEDGAKVVYPDAQTGITFTYQRPDDLRICLDGNEKKLELCDDNQPFPFPNLPGSVKVTNNTSLRITCLEQVAADTTAAIKSWRSGFKARNLAKYFLIKDYIGKPDATLKKATRKIGETNNALNDKDNKKEEIRDGLRNDLAALEASVKTLKTIARKKQELTKAISGGKVIEFKDASGHVVQKITFKVSWGD